MTLGASFILKNMYWRASAKKFLHRPLPLFHVANDAGALEGDEAEAWGIAEAEDALGDTGSDDVSDELELGGGDRGG